MARTKTNGSKSNFCFDNTEEETLESEQHLRKYNMDITQAIEINRNSILKAGAEFRTWSVIEPLVKAHIDTEEIQDIVEKCNIPIQRVL
jgi:hypothetical protein